MMNFVKVLLSEYALSVFFNSYVESIHLPLYSTVNVLIILIDMKLQGW